MLNMGRRKSLKLEQRQRAIGMLQGGMTITNVSNGFRVSPSTISRLRTRYRTTGRVQDRPRTGLFNNSFKELNCSEIFT